MKSADHISTTAPPQKHTPFFSKDSDNTLSKAASRKNAANVQAKLSVGRPDDHYEHEADAMANKVVQRSGDPGPSSPVEPIIPSKSITPLTRENRVAPPAEEKIRKKEEEQPEQDERIQKKPIFESRGDADDENNPVQRSKKVELQAKKAGHSGSEASPEVESKLDASKGSGQPLAEGTKKEMESSFGSDFSKVRIHDDSRAAQLSQDLDAQAFTHGNDIYFNSGKYNTTTTAGKHLLAHELTHTVQQTGSIQRVKKPATGAKSKTASSIDFTSKTITLGELRLPSLKKRNNANIKKLLRPRNYTRKDSYDPAKNTNTAQLDVWKQNVNTGVTAKVEAKLKNARDQKGFDAKTKAYYLINDDIRLIGSKEKIIEAAKVPTWNKNNKAAAFDADHIQELQLSGENVIGNLELLNFSANRASGSRIKNEIEFQINEFLQSQEAVDAAAAANIKKIPSLETVKKSYEVNFSRYTFNMPGFDKGVAEGEYWSFSAISKGSHLDSFKTMNKTQIETSKGSAQDPLVYTSEAGGRAIHKKDKLPGVEFSDYDIYDTPKNGKAGEVKIKIDPDPTNIKATTGKLGLYQVDGVIFGGYVPRRKQKEDDLESVLKHLTVNAFSPVSIDEALLVPGKGVVTKGRIHPTLEFFKGFELDFTIDGDLFTVSKTFSAGDLEGKVPKPFKITNAFLTIGANRKGIFLEGDVLFEIEKLGAGKITGYGGTNGEFGIRGAFDFDKKLFKGKKDAASINVEYNNKRGWSAGGTLTIGPDSVKGLKSGSIIVNYANNVLEASGTAEPKMKGMKEVTLRIKFAEGVSEIEGGVKIEKLPGIKSGEGTMKLVQTGDVYDFSGSGMILPDIPGVSSQLNFEFHNDIFLVDASIGFEKGRLKGNLNVGITNRAIDPATGKPNGEALKDYKVFGNSELSLKLTESITVTAGVKLLENGEIEVKGGIKLPPRMEVIPKLFSVVNKPIVSIPEISIPLFGIPLGVTTLGLEATIAPYIKADAQIGPGYLSNTQAEVIYNPSHPDSLTVTGGADFELIAEASLHAGVDFGVGISIGIAAAKGGINLDAYIKVAAKQPIFHADIKYSPATGFELNGNVKAIVSALLGFSGSLFLSLRAGVWPLKKTWRWDKPLFKKEVDTGLQIGFEFPFNYKNGKADVSFDNMKFVYPKFDGSFLKTLSDKLIKPTVDDLL